MHTMLNEKLWHESPGTKILCAFVDIPEGELGMHPSKCVTLPLARPGPGSLGGVFPNDCMHDC